MPAANKVDPARVRQLLSKGATQKQVAMRLGINKTSVWKVAKEMRKDTAA